MDQTNMDEQIAVMCAAHTKDRVESFARAAGWKGDPARTSKEALARFAIEQAMTTTPAEQPAPMIAPTVAPEVETPRRGAVVEQKNAATVAQAIAAALAGVKMGADPDEVRAMIREELAGIQPARIVIRDSVQHAVKIEERTHPLFEKILRLICARVAGEQRLNVLLVGPAGCGKSHLLAALAKALNSAKTCIVSGSGGATEAHLTGWRLPVDGGKWEFTPAEWLTTYTTDGGFCGLDELDGFDANMLMVTNTATANGHIHVPAARQTFTRGKGVVIVATANTYGNGMDLLYVGRNQLDAATLDRFYVVSMGYDAGLEAAIAGRAFTPAAPWKPAGDPAASELADFGEWVTNLRAKVEGLRLRRVVSTRMIQKGIAARVAGVPMAEVKADLLAGWSRDELQKVGA